jgi:hypothetical protein
VAPPPREDKPDMKHKKIHEQTTQLDELAKQVERLTLMIKQEALTVKYLKMLRT